MVESESTIKRSASSSSPEDGLNPPGAKRVKRHYHHHHRLQSPVNPALPEPAIVDDACVDQLLNRSISQYLRTCGFELADPAALDAFRRVTEEYILSVASYVRQSMLSSRRTQPIPHDFDDALRRHSVPYTDLLPHVQPHPNLDPIPTPQPTPPPEEVSFKTLPSFGPQLSGEDDRVRSSYIPKHFPAFPSKHTYRHTAVFTEREQDARKIRERATEDGRHGEEALRKLARAAFKDNQFGSSAREKKPWGRRAETMDSMFEKTVKGLAKRMQRTATVPGAAAPMEIDSGAGLDTEVKPVRSKLALSIELPPIINCEREFWRRVPSSGARRAAEDKQSGVKKEAHDRASRVDSWAHNRLTNDDTRLGDPALRRITRVLYHLQQLAFLQLDGAALATLLLEVLGRNVDVLGEGFGVKDGDEGFGERLLTEVHEERLNELLHSLRELYQERIGRDTLKTRFGVDELDKLVGIFTAPVPSGQSRADTAQEELPLDPEHDPDDELAHDPPGRTTNTHSAGIPVPAYTSHAEPVLEISSTSSAAGKTNLLYYITALAVLPAEINGFKIGGHDSAVVFMDTDGRFNAERLRSVLRGIVKVKCGAQDMSRLDEEMERMAVSCLKHVHVFQPQSSSALLATLQRLDTYLLDLARHASSSRALRLLILDSANAFYWQDKLQDEMTRVEQIGRPAAEIEHDRRQKQSFYLFDMYTDLVRELKRLQRVFSCAVVFTTTAAPQTTPSRRSHGYQPSGPYDLYNPSDAPAFRRPSFRSALPAPWGTFPVLRVVVQRDPVRPFPAAMGLQEAEENAAKRQEILMRGRFSGWVNMWGREDWPRRWLEGVEALDGGMFFFRMGRDGVQFG
ncbi:uncharacterized protein BO95DRAFT_457218 [Aspergillus brunneoviolaceus CBS 621.78]|uniref:Uncharacterized protein n=1 Tax=Aspergillus brunneoviolaceus CBS 621.78 TaxID=1450534 RepID=A0ACD1FUN4_9EURO|nr:hypothetical protein BO95DRAFT_457218 [Aspergillus brunneoviolaceus CBS 621.78]RAH40636.1 hypothetical protein BO95DRAFT_457218 [Aspergillus brunneoviolaceus CBS 621.78]